MVMQKRLLTQRMENKNEPRDKQKEQERNNKKLKKWNAQYGRVTAAVTKPREVHEFQDDKEDMKRLTRQAPGDAT